MTLLPGPGTKSEQTEVSRAGQHRRVVGDRHVEAETYRQQPRSSGSQCRPFRRERACQCRWLRRTPRHCFQGLGRRANRQKRSRNVMRNERTRESVCVVSECTMPYSRTRAGGCSKECNDTSGRRERAKRTYQQRPRSSGRPRCRGRQEHACQCRSWRGTP